VGGGAGVGAGRGAAGGAGLRARLRADRNVQLHRWGTACSTQGCHTPDILVGLGLRFSLSRICIPPAGMPPLPLLQSSRAENGAFGTMPAARRSTRHHWIAAVTALDRATSHSSPCFHHPACQMVPRLGAAQHALGSLLPCTTLNRRTRCSITAEGVLACIHSVIIGHAL